MHVCMELMTWIAIEICSSRCTIYNSHIHLPRQCAVVVSSTNNNNNNNNNNNKYCSSRICDRSGERYGIVIPDVVVGGSSSVVSG